jgi:flagellar motor switch protein FliN
MSFSASPLVPDQATSGEAWETLSSGVLAAVTQALPQIPAADALSAGEPTPEPTPAHLPDPAGAAIIGTFGGGVEGKVLLVVAQDLVDALEGTPFGKLEPHKALRPALDTLAEALGGRLDGEPSSTPVEDCLDVLAGGAIVMVPLMSGDAIGGLLALSLTAVPEAPGSGSGSGSGAGAAGAGAGGGATAASAARSWGIDMLRDVEMEVTCELGRTRMTVRQLLALAPGDVVELDRLAGAPADLLVNGTLLARGEVVVVDESFGLRITEIVTRDAT